MRRYLLAIALVAALVSQADAALLWGTTRAGGEAPTSILYTVDSVTGATTLVGDTGYAVNGLNYHNGVLYATEAQFGGSLLTINTTTGAGTAIGPLGDATGNGSDRAVLLAIDAAGNAFTWYDPSNDDLASVNLGTGTATIVGESGIGTGAHGMSFLGNTLYLVNFDGSVYTINTGTGAATFVGNAGTLAHHGDVNPDDSLYYGLDQIGDGPRNLVSIDLTTQTIQNSVLLDRGIHTLAFQDQTAVPEPSTMVLVATGLIGVAVTKRRRKQQGA